MVLKNSVLKDCCPIEPHEFPPTEGELGVAKRGVEKEASRPGEVVLGSTSKTS